MTLQRFFVGREADLNVLCKAYEEVKQTGKTRIVALIAESGFGKTRLAQEFYGWLSTEHDGVGGAGYWPDELLQRENNLQVNPDLSECGREGKQMPFLWWGLRVADPGSRNQSLEDALRHGVATLKSHLEAYVHAQKEQELLKQQVSGVKETAKNILADAGKDVIEGWLNTGLFGLLDLGKAVYAEGRNQQRIARELKELESFDASPVATVHRQRDKLTETILQDLAVLAKTPPPGRSAVPLVILIDDIQWLHADPGLEAFLEALTARARAEAWPLLLVFTSWRKEWHDSRDAGKAPGKWMGGDDIPHELGRAPGLEVLVQKAFPGLPGDQRMKLADKADGNPRLLDEMLTYIQRRPKLFVERDQSGPMSPEGLKEVLEKSFADYVFDRLEAAPESVRRALALASLQGVVFSSDLVRRVAAELQVDDVDEGIAQSDTPHSFTTTEEGAEFRLRVYQEAARENTANFFDEDMAQAVTNKYVLSVASDPASANDRELRLAFDALAEATEQDAEVDLKKVTVAAEMIRRANVVCDTRTAGLIAQDLLEAGAAAMAGADLDDTRTVLQAHQTWHGVSPIHVTYWENTVDRLRKDASNQTPGARRDLAAALFDLGDVVDALDGPAAARPLLEESTALRRILAEEQPTPDARYNLGEALFDLGYVVDALDRPAAARPLFEEMVTLLRALADEQPTPDVRRGLGAALGALGDVVKALDGPSAARSLFEEQTALLRALVDEQPTPSARASLAAAFSRLGGVVNALDGPAAARPLYEEEVQLDRALVDEQPTPGARGNLAAALLDLGGVVKTLEDSEAARPLYEEALTLFRELFVASPTPGAKHNLAIALSNLGNVTEALEGSEAARPLYEEALVLSRERFSASPTPNAKHNLAIALDNLATVTEVLECQEAAQPLLEEALSLYRGLAEASLAPDDKHNLAIALYNLAVVNQAMEDPWAARPLYEEALSLCRGLVATSPTLGARRDLVDVLRGLGDVIGELENPAAAEPLYKEALALL